MMHPYPARTLVVVLGVAVRTDADEAGRALKDGIMLRLTVDLRAVRSGAVVELLRTGLYVCQECSAGDSGGVASARKPGLSSSISVG